MRKARVLRLDNSSVAVEGEDADEGMVEQVCQRGAEGVCGGQGLPDADELANVGQEVGDKGELFGAPAQRVVGVRQSPADVTSVRAVHAQVQPVAGVVSTQ